MLPASHELPLWCHAGLVGLLLAHVSVVPICGDSTQLNPPVLATAPVLSALLAAL